MKWPLVYIIILNWNGLHWLKQCFPSILRTNYPCFKVVIVDNASTDQSIDWVRKKYPHIIVIQNKKI